MLARFRERAAAVERRNMPPVAGEERMRFIEQAQLDFQDFAIVGDATWTFVAGVLTPTVDPRPSPGSEKCPIGSAGRSLRSSRCRYARSIAIQSVLENG